MFYTESVKAVKVKYRKTTKTPTLLWLVACYRCDVGVCWRPDELPFRAFKPTAHVDHAAQQLQHWPLPAWPQPATAALWPQELLQWALPHHCHHVTSTLIILSILLGSSPLLPQCSGYSCLQYSPAGDLPNMFHHLSTNVWWDRSWPSTKEDEVDRNSIFMSTSPRRFLFVCLFARLHKIYSLDYIKTWWEDGDLAQEEPVKIGLESGNVGR